MITGKDLIEMGYKPNETFKRGLEFFNAGNVSVEELRSFMDSIQPNHIEPFEQPVPYHMNIRGETEEEKQNIQDVAAAMDSVMKLPTVVTGCVMPDACPTGKGQIPVGGVVVTRNAIHPSMHSADICCSLMVSDFADADPKEVLDIAQSVTHFGGGGRPDPFEIPSSVQIGITKNPYLNTVKSLELARTHLVTQGDGNHFLFVGRSKNTGNTMLVTHHGSRGFGANLYRKGMEVAEKFRKQLSPKSDPKNPWIPADTQEGQIYWDALQVVRDWTYYNHFLLHREVSIHSPYWCCYNDAIWNEHNFVFCENDLFYHAKGATPLDNKFVPDSSPAGLRVIPLNMGQPILIVRGSTTKTNLGFAPHGAGRNFSRSQHKNSQTGKTDEEIFTEETKNLDVRFFSGNVDISELPSAYKNAAKVRAQIAEFNLGTIVDEIEPYGCIMAGDWEKNAPWRNKRK